MKLITDRLIDGLHCGRIDMVIKYSDLELKINAMMRVFLDPTHWKELSKKISSKILLCGDGSFWKTFKPIASLITKGKLKQISNNIERASVLHQPDGVESQRYHIVPFEELNGVSIALVATVRVVSKSTDRIFISREGEYVEKARTESNEGLRG
nr:hypothetical protein [Tanacetum cinerariifolium]